MKPAESTAGGTVFPAPPLRDRETRAEVSTYICPPGQRGVKTRERMRAQFPEALDAPPTARAALAATLPRKLQVSHVASTPGAPPAGLQRPLARAEPEGQHSGLGARVPPCAPSRACLSR